MEVKTIRRANSNSTILYNKKLSTLLCFSFPISLYKERLECKFHSLGYYCTHNLSFHRNSTRNITWNFLVTYQESFSFFQNTFIGLCMQVHNSKFLECLLKWINGYKLKTAQWCFKSVLLQMMFGKKCLSRFVLICMLCNDDLWCQQANHMCTESLW